MQAQLHLLAENELGGQDLECLLSTLCKQGECDLPHGIRSLSPLHHTTTICASSPIYISISFHVTFTFH